MNGPPVSAIAPRLSRVRPGRRLSGRAGAAPKAAEAACSESLSAALESAHTQLQALFELSPLGMALSMMDDGRMLDCNDAFVRLLGHDHARVLTLTHRDLIPPDMRHIALANRQNLLDHGRFEPIEIELLHADGHRLPVLLSSMVAVLPDGTQRIWSILQDLTPRKTIETRLRIEAHTDRLTGLPNRTLLMERLEQCVARTRADPTHHFALLFLDFDRFKLVNDTLGHDAGDQLLQHVADRLRRSLRTGDVFGNEGSENIVARFGGDEFVVLLSEARSADAAAVVARRLLDVLSNPYFVAQREVNSSASIGIAIADETITDAGDLLRNADMAMYEAKRAGRSTYAFFEPAMLTKVSRSVHIEEALRRAVALNQLTLVYQPIVSLQSGLMTSVEALVRWRHPELGDVPPSEFIPIAEDSGLIVPIGEWVLWQACRQWMEWQQLRPADAPASISVNLSRVQMALGDRLLALVGARAQEHRHAARLSAARGDRTRGDARAAGCAQADERPCARWASASRWTTSAPAPRRSAACATTRSTSSRSTSRSSTTCRARCSRWCTPPSR